MNINDYIKVTDRIKPEEKCRDEVLEMKEKKNREKIKYTHSKRFAAVIAAAAVFMCGGTAIGIAKEMGVFSKIGNNLDNSFVNEYGVEVPVDKFEKHDFEQIEQAAQVFTSPIPLENDSIDMRIESVYCDKNTVILGITGSLKNGNPDNARYVRFTTDFIKGDLNYNTSYRLNRNSSGAVVYERSMLYLDEGTQNSFTGMIELMFNSNAEITEPQDIEFRLRDFTPNSNTYGIIYEEEPLEGEFRFSLRVEPDESQVRHIQHTYTNGEQEVTIGDITPSYMQIKTKMPTPEEIEEEDRTGKKICWFFYDANGEEIQHLETNSIYIGGREYWDLFQPPKTDTFTIEFRDANNNMELLNTITIDLNAPDSF